MRQMFSKKQIEELAKLGIAGASNEEKQNFIPECKLLTITTQASEGVVNLTSEEYLFTRINLVIEEHETFTINLPESIKAYLQFDGIAPDWTCWNSNKVYISGNDYVEEGEEGAVLVIYTFKTLAIVCVFDNT